MRSHKVEIYTSTQLKPHCAGHNVKMKMLLLPAGYYLTGANHMQGHTTACKCFDVNPPQKQASKFGSSLEGYHSKIGLVSVYIQYNIIIRIR